MAVRRNDPEKGRAVRQEREVQVLTVRVPVEVHEALRTLAMATDRSLNEVVLGAVRNYLAEKGHREAVTAFLREAQDQYRVALDKLASL